MSASPARSIRAPRWTKTGFNLFTKGNVNTIGNQFTDWQSSNLSLTLNMINAESGLAGCQPPPFPYTFPNGEDLNGFFQTCPSGGIGGALVFTFHSDTNLHWSSGDAALDWNFTTIDPQTGGGQFTACTPGVNCLAVSNTPEPAPLILMASGLVMVGLVGKKTLEGQNTGG